MSRKILMIVHQRSSVPGRIGQALVERGYGLDIRRPRFGDPLPRSMSGHRGAIVFGGPMSANDDEDYIRREIDWLEVPLAEEAPLLGVCLGAQMLVKKLGGEVTMHAQGKAEIGYFPIRPTAAGRALCRWPERVYQWHRESFTLPDGVELLVRGEVFENQAFRYGAAAYGVQFHPEMTLAMMHRWLTSGAARLALPGAQPREKHFEGRAVHDREVRRWLDAFLDHWLGLGKARD